MTEFVAIHTQAIHISYSVRLRVARSTQMGRCHSLNKRDEQQIQTLALFLYNHLKANELGLLAQIMFMKIFKQLLLLFGVLTLALPAVAHDFTYTYEGQTLTYTVLDEYAKACLIKGGSWDNGRYPTPGNDVSGSLIIPEVVEDNGTKYKVTNIDPYAFACCYQLTEVTIPKSVKVIGGYSFAFCTGLTAVYYQSLNPAQYNYNDFTVFMDDNYEIYNNATLYVPAEAVDIYRTCEPWKNFKNIEAYDFSGIEEASADFDSEKPSDVYSINGVTLSGTFNTLTPGIYIVRQGSAVKKIAVQ